MLKGSLINNESTGGSENSPPELKNMQKFKWWLNSRPNITPALATIWQNSALEIAAFLLVGCLLGQIKKKNFLFSSHYYFLICPSLRIFEEETVWHDILKSEENDHLSFLSSFWSLLWSGISSNEEVKLIWRRGSQISCLY